MKKITAILIALLMVLTLIACVDNGQGDKDGDVALPTSSSTESSETKKSNGGGVLDENGNINLPIDTFK